MHGSEAMRGAPCTPPPTARHRPDLDEEAVYHCVTTRGFQFSTTCSETRAGGLVIVGVSTPTVMGRCSVTRRRRPAPQARSRAPPPIAAVQALTCGPHAWHAQRADVLKHTTTQAAG